MSHSSLARIMYGTGEDSHTSDGMNANASSSGLTSSMKPDAPGGFASQEQHTLGEFFHKAWLFLSTKH